jgi:hypothetical protein
MISAQVEAYLVHLGAQEVGGAGGFADHQREEVLSTDLPYPKSGYYDKQQRCEDCEDGCPIWWLGKGWAVVLGVPVGLCVVGQIACRILYVAVIVPNERTDLVTKVLAMDTVRNPRRTSTTQLSVGCAVLNDCALSPRMAGHELLYCHDWGCRDEYNSR